MNRPTRWKARLAPAIVAALLLVPAQAAEAGPGAGPAPAGDEYVLQLPGVRQSASDVAQPGRAADAGGGVQRGVVGETDEPAGPLAALGDALGALPASILAGLAALGALALLGALLRRRLTPLGARPGSAAAPGPR